MDSEGEKVRLRKDQKTDTHSEKVCVTTTDPRYDVVQSPETKRVDPPEGDKDVLVPNLIQSEILHHLDW